MTNEQIDRALDLLERYVVVQENNSRAGLALARERLAREREAGDVRKGSAGEAVKRTSKRHPMQPVVWDGKGVVRFQQNPIVRWLLDWASDRGMNLNDLAKMSDRVGWTKNDWEHFAQLTGYSVSGWGDLSYVRDSTCAKAQVKVERLLATHPADPATSRPSSETKETDR